MTTTPTTPEMSQTAAAPIPDPWFGLRAPEGARMAWGARAIYDMRQETIRFTKTGKRLKRPRMVDRASIDLLPDRQSWSGERDPKFVNWINRKALPWLRRECERAYLTSDSCDTLTMSQGAWTIQATPRASYGYLYLVAFDVPAPVPAPGEADPVGV